ncbi:ribonuclease J [Helicobacter pullorum]|uniref:Ribonuclease J n=1 Tax=Helicobacter pullorum TaxID=35818 RepID=A0A0N0LUH6_9HELI|nr:ribonuclease J [Helicobacter pullorum]HIS09316.1 ribonuclease J [Candidatus Scatomorpha intestinipullorum]KAB0574354.1 ribonuclease J [Helicobacter pullorum NCTC 12824]KPH51775.1 ribonuclease J [Helicobacter pullorum]KPH52594.1 ribonuclease J [Helicobacter pullorum]KPH56409.1 ribonuclease J [Helicobacter pullorum]
MEEKETQNNTQNTNSQKEPNKRRFKPRNQQDRTREEKQGQEGQSRNHYRHKKSQNNSGQNGEKFHNRNGGNREVNQSNLELRKAVEVNAKVHQNSLTTHSQVQFNPNGKVRITPIGGLGEIGGNMTVIETQNSAIIIDAGMSFPDGDMHGIDILVPDFSYLEVIKDKIAGIVITHAHEDHIGAMPYLFKKYQFPIYGTPLPLGLIGSKFDEHGLKKYRSLFRAVEKRKPIRIGEFEIEWIHITHSIVDSSALAIKTEAGVIFHTGDFKIDHTPIDGYPTDLNRIAYYGEQGVLLLLSDSTNSHKAGYTPSEASVGPAFDMLFSRAKGRVIMSTFSSNIHRVYQAIQYGLKYGRKISVIGRSMEKNLEIARTLGYIDLPQNIFIEAHEVAKYADEEVLIVTTGSQGETMSALYRMATDEHRHIKIKPSDIVILSAKAIPGNEGSVSNILNFINKAGAKVYYQDFSEIHTSGHAAQEEQKLMLRLVKPKFFLPVHGEYNHILKHKETAISCGVDEKNIYLMEDGDQIEIAHNYLRKVRSVKTGKIYIDNQINAFVANDVVLDRQNLAENGIVIVVVQIDKAKNAVIGKPRIQTMGIIANKDILSFNKEIEEFFSLFVKNCKKELYSSQKAMENEIRNALRKLMFKKTKRYPTIMPNVIFS